MTPHPVITWCLSDIWTKYKFLSNLFIHICELPFSNCVSYSLTRTYTQSSFPLFPFIATLSVHNLLPICLSLLRSFVPFPTLFFLVFFGVEYFFAEDPLFYHVCQDAVIILHVHFDLFAHQLLHILRRNALWLADLHSKHVQAQHRAFRDGHLSHH